MLDRFIKLVIGYFVFNSSRSTAVGIETAIRKFLDGEEGLDSEILLELECRKI